MSKLRTDKPLMSDKEVKDYVEHMEYRLHVSDLMSIHEILGKDIEEHNLELLFNKVNKMCDKCRLVYPERITICFKCNNDKLRSFKVHNNMHELRKPNW